MSGWLEGVGCAVLWWVSGLTGSYEYLERHDDEGGWGWTLRVEVCVVVVVVVVGLDRDVLYSRVRRAAFGFPVHGGLMWTFKS